MNWVGYLITYGMHSLFTNKTMLCYDKIKIKRNIVTKVKRGKSDA